MVTAEIDLIQQRRAEDPIGQARIEYEEGEVDLALYPPEARLEIASNLVRSDLEFHLINPLLKKVRQLFSPSRRRSSLTAVVE